MTDDLSGVIAAVPTPLDANGRPDTARLLAHCDWALAHGCDGLNLLGTTGEASSLPTRSRAAVMRAAAGRLDGRRLMVGTGTPVLAATIELTRLAAELGFAAALVLPPYYYKPLDDDALFAWFARLVEALDGAQMAIPLQFPATARDSVLARPGSPPRRYLPKPRARGQGQFGRARLRPRTGGDPRLRGVPQRWNRAGRGRQQRVRGLHLGTCCSSSRREDDLGWERVAPRSCH